MKVLFHLDDTPRWKMALGNIANMLQYGKDNAVPFEIELVVNGPAVLELRPEAAKAAGIWPQLEAVGQAVRICACRNALNANGIDPQALPPFVHTVPAGVVELAMRQGQGYAYIKP